MPRKKFSKDEVRAYWIGVGISSAIHKESNHLLNSSNPKIKKAVRKGYQDDNSKDLTKKFK